MRQVPPDWHGFGSHGFENSHLSPVLLAGQEHSNWLFVDRQTPPFVHGLGLHGFAMSHVTPMCVGGQVQSKLFAESYRHVPFD